MPYTLLQISDCHLGDTPGDALLGLNADQSLAWVLELIKATVPHCDALICSGDLTNEGGKPALQRFKNTLSSLHLPSPVYWLPGNHDDSEVLQLLSAPEANADNQPLSVPAFTLGNWHISLFDSSIPNKVPGSIGAPDLQRMQQTLQDKPAHHHMFVLHHPLLKVGSAWIDPQRVDNAEHVIQLIEQNPQCKMVVSGHVHQSFDQALSEHTLARMITTPSTSVQFKPHSDDFALDSQMPGFRWFTLHDDGSFDTGVKRISSRDLGIQHNSTGY